VVSNSFDADATRVEITIDRRSRQVTIGDNGSGMSPDEFEFYLRIAGRQRSRPKTTFLGRKRIGQFGIGFLAVFPFCNTLQVESTVEGSATVFRAWIPASQFQPDVEPQEDLTATDVTGEEFVDERQRLSHYTKLTLIDTTDLFEKYFASVPPTSQRSLSIRSWPAMDRLRWELADILPVLPPSRSRLTEHVYQETGNFTVTLNGIRLFANDYVEEVLDHSGGAGEKVGKVRFRYAIGTAWKAIHPNEARGLRVRLNGVGVGLRTYFDLNVAGRTFSRLHWLSGDVNITEGLDESIALDRDNFTSTEDYDALREFFRSKVRELAFYIEDIDVARRKIAQQTTGSPRASTESRREVIEEQLERLKRRGFTINEEMQPARPTQVPPPAVSIDTAARTVTVRPLHPAMNDTIRIGRRLHTVKFESWDYRATSLKACRFDDDGSIVFNQQYPLFRGPHQDIFRRLQVILLEAQSDTTSKEAFFEKVQEMLVQEFAGQ